MKPVIFSPEAEEEWFQFVNYYEERKPGLGLEFERAVRSSAEIIAKNPQHWPKVGSTQRYVMTRFPFSPFYIDLSNCVYIITEVLKIGIC